MWATLAAAVAVLGFIDAHPLIIASAWMPYLYVPTFLCFVVSAASVAAGRTRHLWLLCGHRLPADPRSRLLLPVRSGDGGRGAAAAAVFLSAGSPPLTAVSRFFRERRSHWIPAAVTCVVFAVPVVADVVLHWPGGLGAYLRYMRSAQAGHHALSAALRYILWYWWDGSSWIALVVAIAVSVLASVSPCGWPMPALRRFLLATLGMNALASVLMLYYAMRGIDYLVYPYMGYFYWAIPMLTLVVAVIGVITTMSGARSRHPVWVSVVIMTAARGDLHRIQGPRYAHGCAGQRTRAGDHDGKPGVPRSGPSDYPPYGADRAGRCPRPCSSGRTNRGASLPFRPLPAGFLRDQRIHL